MAVGRDPSRPVGMPVAEIEDMTYEDLDLRTLGTLKKPNMSHGEIQTIPPAAPLPRTTEGSASQGMSTAQAISAALQSDEEADIEMVGIPPEAAGHLPTMPVPMPTSARLFRASVDAAAAAYDPGPKTNDGTAADLDLPPPPNEPPGQLQRPGLLRPIQFPSPGRSRTRSTARSTASSRARSTASSTPRSGATKHPSDPGGVLRWSGVGAASPGASLAPYLGRTHPRPQIGNAWLWRTQRPDCVAADFVDERESGKNRVLVTEHAATLL